MAALLGIPGVSLPPVSGELRLERIIDVLVSWISAESRRQPLVMLIEDLHWCDPTTIDTLTLLLIRLSKFPILLLLTARPEFEPPWEGADLTTLRVDPLGEGYVRELVHVLAEGRSLPEPVVDRIVTSAAGIPLFVEEVERSVLESGLLIGADDAWVLASPLMDLEIPSTLQGSLLARLDTLGPAKSVAQLAAVIGRTFSLDLLVRVSGMDPIVLTGFLDRVIASGLVRQESDHADDEFFIFKHVLVQEVAYESLLRRNRRTIHERVAHELDARIAAGSSAPVEEVARHYQAAGLFKESAQQFQLAASLATERSGRREAIASCGGGSTSPSSPPTSRRGGNSKWRCSSLSGRRSPPGSYSDPGFEVAYDRAGAARGLAGE